MTFIGIAQQTRLRGVVGMFKCPNCHEAAEYRLANQRPMLAVADTPLVPIALSESLVLLCSNCSAAVSLRKGDVDVAERLVHDYRQYQQGLLGREDYQKTLVEFGNRVGADLRPEPTAKQAARENPALN